MKREYMSCMHVQDQAGGAGFGVIVLGATGMQLGVLGDDTARRVLCSAACIVVEAWGSGAHSGVGQQYQQLVDSCPGPGALVEVRAMHAALPTGVCVSAACNGRVPCARRPRPRRRRHTATCPGRSRAQLFTCLAPAARDDVRAARDDARALLRL